MPAPNRQIEKITAAMFPEIYDRLLHPFSPYMRREVFKRAFVPRGWHDEDHFGYVLRVVGEPVGMLGALFSRRQIDGSEVRFCNLHNWYVQPAHRASSLLLMRPILALQDCVITDLSASGEVVAISERLGFTKIDRTIRVLPPIPWRGRGVELIDLAAEPHRAVELLSPEDQIIFRDHQDIHCQHWVVRNEAETCYLVASKIPSRWMPHTMVHYLSNPRLFAQHHAFLRGQLLRNGGGRYVAVNEPHLASAKASIPCSFRADSNQRLVRGNQVGGKLIEPAAIDSLYSELALFKLPCYPRPPKFMRGVALQLWKWQQRWKTRPSDIQA